MLHKTKGFCFTLIKRILALYNKDTPAFWRKVGDALLVIGSALTTYNIANENHTVAIAALILCTLGKFLTNAFSNKHDR